VANTETQLEPPVQSLSCFSCKPLTRRKIRFLQVSFDGPQGFMAPFPSVCAVCTFKVTDETHYERLIEPGTVSFSVGPDASLQRTLTLSGKATPVP
jgi:hypothetical protein